MSKIRNTWFSNPPTKDVQIDVPIDIKDLIDKGHSISRYNHPEYPPNAFYDDVTAHIYD